MHELFGESIEVMMKVEEQLNEIRSIHPTIATAMKTIMEFAMKADSIFKESESDA